MLLSIINLSEKTMAKMYLNISVDWEGREISEKNIKAMKTFRRDHPHVPMLHFLNAAYFTKKNAKVQKIRQQISEVLKPMDEKGLHIHSWKSLVTKASVTYRKTPSWRTHNRHTSCENDCGHDIPISAYTLEEIRKIIQTSHKILAQNGFGKATSFRAGGWMASPRVLKALSLEGITLDASSVPKIFLERSQPVITSWISEIWPNTKTTSQPYEIKLLENKILEFPNNGCLADYMTGDMMFKVFKQNVKLWKRDTKRDIFVSLGFHQETAFRYLDRLRIALKLIDVYIKENKIPMTYLTNPLKLQRKNS